MRKVVHIKDISIHENKIFLHNEDKIEKVKFENKSFSMFCNVENNIVDLEELIKRNKIILFEERSYKLYEVSGTEERLICISQGCLNNSKYIAKSFKANIEGVIYFINIYVYEDLNIEITIKKEDAYNIDFEALCVSDEEISLDISFENIDTIEKAKLILLGNSYNEMFEFPYEKIGNDKLRFNIDLMKLLCDKSYKLSTLIDINDEIYSLKVPKDISFKAVKLERDKLLKFVSSSVDIDGRLFLNVDNDINIKPIITSVELNENLIVKGKINSSISLTSSDLISSYINISSNDGKISISYPVNVENDSFILSLDRKTIKDLKESNKELWNITFEALINGEVVVASPVLPMDNNIVVNNKVVLNYNDIVVDNENIITEFVLINSNDAVKLSITNSVNVVRVIFIKVKGKKLVVRFRTQENVEELLNNDQLSADIIVNNKKIHQHKIKKIGKKTFEVDYLIDNGKTTVEEISKKGIDVLVKSNNKISCSKISDIDKDTIYNSFFERVQHSKRYKSLCNKLYKKLFLKMPIKKKTILFESFLGRNVSGNPKYLYNQLVKDGLDKKYELVWILNNLDEPVEGKCKKVKRRTLKYYYYMATAKYWIFNCRQADEIKKRKENIYLQTWHGTPLKKLGMDMDSVNMAGQTDINDYKEKFKNNTRTWDYLLAQNHYSSEIFKRAFAFDKTILEGYPANDILYAENNKESIEKVKDRLGVPKDKKVVLYAPTWRDDNFYKKGHYRMDIQLDLDKMQAELGNEYVVLLRMHYLITNNINIDKYDGFVLNYSDGYDIQELYLISDVLITDYSSVMFDYSNLKRPIIFFTYDIEQYRDSLRGFYFDFEEEAPGPLVTDTEGVIDSLKSLEEINEKYKEKQIDFYNKFCHIDDGHAAENILKAIL